MSIVSFAFGSFGDIAMLLQLAWNLRRTLHGAAEASKDIQDAIASVDSFTLALQSVKGSIESATHMPPSVCNGIIHALSACTTILQRLSARIEAHRIVVVKTHGARVWKGYWAACAWTLLGGKADFDALKRQLVDHLSAIQLLLTTLERDHSSNAMSRYTKLGPVAGSLDRYDAPFHFFDTSGKALPPLLRISHERFNELCAQHSFSAHSSERGVLQKLCILSALNVEVWFQYFVYEDPTMFARESVLVSPVFLKRGRAQSVSRQYCSALLASSENDSQGRHIIIIEGENELDHELTLISGERLIIWSGCVVVPVRSRIARQRRALPESEQKATVRRPAGRSASRIGHRY